MRCHYCGYDGGKHDVVCPESFTGDAKEQVRKEWRAGYDWGRLGNIKPTATSATYSLGWLRGEAALEEAENGYDARFDDNELVNVSADPVAYDTDGSY